MNSFQTIESGKGLLKDQYAEETPVSRALRKRADKLKEKTYVPTKKELEQTDDEE